MGFHISSLNFLVWTHMSCWSIFPHAGGSDSDEAPATDIAAASANQRDLVSVNRFMALQKMYFIVC